MEFPTLGKNCEYSECYQLDFLPIKCKFCQKYFCSEHFLPEVHSCTEYKPAIAQTADIVIEAYKCSVPGCNKTELAPVLCNYCSLQICLLHRHQPDHHCEKLEPVYNGMTNTKAVVENILSTADQGGKPTAFVKKPRSLKAQKTAAKVQLMKLKMKSNGDKTLPQTERIYFLVTPPGGRPARGAWVSSRWVMGKVIDSLATTLGVENKNNLQSAAKLKLFRSLDGASVSEDPSQGLEMVIKREDLFNGDSVDLLYVEEPDCT